MGSRTLIMKLKLMSGLSARELGSVGADGTGPLPS